MLTNRPDKHFWRTRSFLHLCQICSYRILRLHCMHVERFPTWFAVTGLRSSFRFMKDHAAYRCGHEPNACFLVGGSRGPLIFAWIDHRKPKLLGESNLSSWHTRFAGVVELPAWRSNRRKPNSPSRKLLKVLRLTDMFGDHQVWRSRIFNQRASSATSLYPRRRNFHIIYDELGLD